MSFNEKRLACFFINLAQLITRGTRLQAGSPLTGRHRFCFVAVAAVVVVVVVAVLAVAAFAVVFLVVAAVVVAAALIVAVVADFVICFRVC